MASKASCNKLITDCDAVLTGSFLVLSWHRCKVVKLKTKFDKETLDSQHFSRLCYPLTKHEALLAQKGLFTVEVAPAFSRQNVTALVCCFPSSNAGIF